MTSPLTEYWNDLRDGREMPAYAQFDPTAIAQILTDLIVIRVHYDPLDFEYSLVGSNVRKIHRENRRGQKMSMINGQGEGSQIWTFLSDVVTRREALTFIVPYAGPVDDIDGIQSHVTPWAGDDDEVSRLVILICNQHLLGAIGGRPSAGHLI